MIKFNDTSVMKKNSLELGYLWYPICTQMEYLKARRRVFDEATKTSCYLWFPIYACTREDACVCMLLTGQFAAPTGLLKILLCGRLLRVHVFVSLLFTG